MSNLGHISATASLNIDPFQQSTRVLEQQAKALDRTLRATETAFKNNGKSVNGMKGSYSAASKSVDAYTALLDKQNKEYEDYKKQIGDVNNATDKEIATLMRKEQAIANTTSKLENMKGKQAEYAKAIAISENTLINSGKKLEEFGNKTEQYGDKMQKFGSAATKGLTIPIVAGVTAAVKAASDYESAFAGVRKTVDMTEPEFERLSDGIRNMAKEMPASASSIAEVAEAAGQLGIKNENILTFSETMVNMGVATNLAAEEAATSLARFANVMGMDQTKFENLGSSIVALGNNFATTELEIVGMALRLSGVGKQIGMSEADVMGLAAAMSSVGIEAEAGGSAMTQSLKKMQDSVSTYKNSTKMLADARQELNDKDYDKFVNQIEDEISTMENFAKTAGLTADEFQNMFESNPAEALTHFVEGLQKASNDGENLNQILGTLGITGIREADALLRLAGNSEILGEALSTSAQGWEENSALSEEAGERYKTLESKLQMLKNELVDVGIEFGGPFVDALKSGLDTAKPFIKTLSDLAKKFSEASPETQQMVMKTLAFGAAVGPVSKIAGSFTSLLGKGVSTVGKFAQKMGLMQVDAQLASGGLTLASGGLKTFTSGASVATGGLGKFAMAAAGINPVVLGVTAALAAGVAVWQLWGKEAVGSVKRNYEWGAEVTKEQDKVLDKTKNLATDAIANMDLYQAGVTESADKVKKAYQSIGDEAEKAMKKQQKHNQSVVDSLPEDMQKTAQDQINKNKENDEKILSGIQNRVDRATEIMDTAYKNNRKLTSTENAELLRLTDDLSRKQLDALKISEEAKASIMDKMSVDFINKSPKQMEAYAASMSKALEKEQKAYKKQKEFYENEFADNPIKMEQELAKLENRHNDTTERIVANFTKAKLAAGTSAEDMAVYLGEMGYTLEEANKLVAKFGDEALIMGDKIATGTSEADNAWNSLILDEKTGEVKENLNEFLVDIAKTDEGWATLQLVAKEATITSNARTEIAVAIGEAGRWDKLSLDEKFVLVDGDQAQLELLEAINSVNGWDKVEPLVKELGVHNLEAVTKLITSKELLDKYEKLKPEEKKLLIDASQGKEITMTSEKLRDYQSIKDLLKHLKITADTSGAIQAKDAIDRIPDNTAKNIWINTYRNDMGTKTQVNNGNYPIGNEKGTNYHRGGLAMVNDQRGPLYKELVTLPNGDSFIPQGRDVVLPLPKGSQVLKASLTDKIIPHFANGTDYTNTTAMQFINGIKNSPSTIEGPSNKIDELISYFKNYANRPIYVTVEGQVLLENGREIGKFVAKPVRRSIKEIERSESRLKGER